MFKIKRLPLMVSILGLWVCLLIQVNTGFACTRILWNTNKQATVVARSMDWNHPFGERLVDKCHDIVNRFSCQDIVDTRLFSVESI